MIDMTEIKLNTPVQIQKKVILTVVEAVSPGDFRQTQKTMEALEAAGMESGRPLVNALSLGHNYHVKEIELEQPFNQAVNSQAGGYGVYQDALISFRHRSDPSKLLGPQNLSGKEITVISQNVVSLESKDNRVVDITAILRQKQAQINSSEEKAA